MRSLRGKLILIVLVAGGLIILNPDIDQHRNKIAEKFKEQNPVSGALGAGEILKQLVQYDNYYFFSKGKISVSTETVSYGIAGIVIIPASLDLMKYKDQLPELDIPK